MNLHVLVRRPSLVGRCAAIAGIRAFIALTALRKRLVLCFGVLKTGKRFDPQATRAAGSLAVPASMSQRCPWSFRRAANQVSCRAIMVSAVIQASLACTRGKAMIALPNCCRSRA